MEEKKPYLSHFFWLQPPPSSGLHAAWHVVLGQEHEGPFGKAAVVLSDTLTMEQSESMGFPLPEVLNLINVEILKENELLKHRIAELEHGLTTSTTPEPEDSYE